MTMAATKKAAPRVVWGILHEDGFLDSTYATRAEAKRSQPKGKVTRIVGPYVLAERARER
jgi:hypothetical protein